jgi:hypothetical protein
MISLQHPKIRTPLGVRQFHFAARPGAITVSSRPLPRNQPIMGRVLMRAAAPATVVRRRSPTTWGRRAVKKLPLRVRGLGQVTTTPSVGLPSCGTDTATNTGQIVLGAGGGLAMVVGIIGAIVSDQYREDFAIAAGIGLLASFVGAAWAVGSASACAAQGVQSIASSVGTTQTPAPSTQAPVATASGAVQLPYAVPTNTAISSTF